MMPNTVPMGPQMGPVMNPVLMTDPNYVAQTLQLQRQQALAQALTQQGMGPIDYDPRGRISPLQGINKMLAAYLGGTMGNQAIQRQAQLSAQGMGAMMGQAEGTAAQINGQGSPAPSPATQALSQGAASGSVGPTVQNAATMNALPPRGQSVPGVQVTPQDIVMARMGDPVALEKVKTALANSAITPEQKNAAAFGQDYTRHLVSIPVRANGGIVGPGGAITMLPSSAAPGYQNVQLADGSWGAVPVRGGTQALTQSTAAEQSGKPMQYFDPVTKRPMMGWTGDVLGAPGQGAPQVGQPGQPAQSPAAPASSGAVVTPAAQLQAIRESIPIIQQELAQATDPQTKAALQRQLNDAQARLSAGTPFSSPGGYANSSRGVQTGPGLGEGATADTLGTQSAKDAVENYNELHTAATTSAPRAIGLLQSIQQLADKTLVGPGSNKVQFFNGLLNMMGITPTGDSARDYQLLQKNSAMLVAAQRQSAGGSGTDALQSLLSAANPSADHMNAPAMKEAADELIAYNRMIMAKDRMAPNPMAVGPQAYANFETKFAPFNDPRLWQLEHAQNDQERMRILSLMPLDQRGQFLNLAKQARANGYLN